MLSLKNTFSLTISFKHICLSLKNICLDFYCLQIPTMLILASIGAFTLIPLPQFMKSFLLCRFERNHLCRILFFIFDLFGQKQMKSFILNSQFRSRIYNTAISNHKSQQSFFFKPHILTLKIKVHTRNAS